MASDRPRSGSRRRLLAGGVVAATMSLAAACSAAVGGSAPAGSGTTTPVPADPGTTSVVAAAPEVAFAPTTAPPPLPLVGPTAGACPTTSAATTPTAVFAGVPDDPAGSSTTTTVPTPDSALAGLLGDPRVAGRTVSVSVGAPALGEIISSNPDTALRPASNQKLVTAMAALALLDPREQLHTLVVATGPVVNGVLEGDLVLVGGGDPTVIHAGSPHSLDALGGMVEAAGITRVAGRLLVDDSRYDDVRMGVGWPADWNANIGPMSALVVDRNLYRHDPEFLADPAIGNGEVLRAALAFRGVAIDGDTVHGSGDKGIVVGSLSSPTVNELVNVMLLRSDNLHAELLVKEIAHRLDGAPGSTAAGLTRIRQFLQSTCVDVTSTDVDGSGLSYDNYRSAREFRLLLQAAKTSSWGSLLWYDLPVAGQMGALPSLAEPPTAGQVRAKGGSLAITRALSGYVTTVSGRQLTFSVIVNGGSAAGAEAAIYEFVTALAGLRV